MENTAPELLNYISTGIIRDICEDLEIRLQDYDWDTCSTADKNHLAIMLSHYNQAIDLYNSYSPDKIVKFSFPKIEEWLISNG